MDEMQVSDLQSRDVPEDGSWWGEWKYEADSLVLSWKGSQDNYYVDLEDCTDAAQILDWLLQIAHKSWATSKDVGDLLFALDELAGDLQGEVCPFGQNTQFSYREHLREAHPPSP